MGKSMHRKIKRTTRNGLERLLGGGFSKVKDMEYTRRSKKYMTYTGMSKKRMGVRACFCVDNATQFIQEAPTWTMLAQRMGV